MVSPSCAGTQSSLRRLRKLVCGTRASTSLCSGQGVDGRDKPGHDVRGDYDATCVRGDLCGIARVFECPRRGNPSFPLRPGDGQRALDHCPGAGPVPQEWRRCHRCHHLPGGRHHAAQHACGWRPLRRCGDRRHRDRLRCRSANQDCGGRAPPMLRTTTGSCWRIPR